MSKYVRETSAGKSISAYVILRHGKELGTVLSHYGNGGSVLVNVFQRDAAAKRSASAASKKQKGKPPHDAADFCFQHARAGGGGYDKFTAALAGMWFDGHQLTDHCGGPKPKPPKGRKTWPHGTKPPRGYQFANFVSQYIGWGDNKRENSQYQGEEGYTSCYRIEGLKYLEAIGYTVIQVI